MLKKIAAPKFFGKISWLNSRQSTLFEKFQANKTPVEQLFLNAFGLKLPKIFIRKEKVS